MEEMSIILVRGGYFLQSLVRAEITVGSLEVYLLVLGRNLSKVSDSEC